MDNTDSQLLWKEGKKTLLLKTTVLDVTSIESTSSDGLKGDYIVMDAKDWAIVIPDAGDSFLMVKQWRHGERALSIEFPGGVIETGESPEKAAARELKEETGFSAGRLVKLGSMNPNPALMSNHVHVFAAFDLQPAGEQHLDEDEYVSYFEMPKEEVYAKMGTKEFPHALMAAGLALYREYIAKQ
ncbi:MAG: NUDIX hydrolase [Treponema sp.]|nr:NUDIX hydrolase [Treponema sp.]